MLPIQPLFEIVKLHTFKTLPPWKNTASLQHPIIQFVLFCCTQSCCTIFKFENPAEGFNQHKTTFPRDPGSPNLRMVSWNLNTFRFVSVIGDPEGSSSDVRWLGSLGLPNFVPRHQGDSWMYPAPNVPWKMGHPYISPISGGYLWVTIPKNPYRTQYINSMGTLLGVHPILDKYHPKLLMLHQTYGEYHLRSIN